MAQVKRECGVDLGSGKRHRGPDEMATALMVPPAAVSLVIGKQGEMIKNIQSSCDVKMSFSKVDEVILGIPLRRCNINGSVDGLCGALQMMGSFAYEPDAAAKVVFVVPDAQVSLLIGKQGANIKLIEQMSGTMLSFAKKHEMAPEIANFDRALTITGMLESIILAFREVLMLLAYFDSQSVPHDGLSFPGPQSVQAVHHSPAPRVHQDAYETVSPCLPNHSAQYLQTAPPRAYRPTVSPLSGSEQFAQVPHVGVAIEMKLLVPDRYAGSLIGVKGAQIKAMTDACRPEKIFISFGKTEENEMCPDTKQPLRPVTLRGTPGSCARVHGMLLESLSSLSARDGDVFVCRSMVVVGTVEPQ
jgi:transcription antitermination factor NusA-like protein